MLSALPAAGFDGEPPDFPLPGASAREIELWEHVWSLPQAVAWSIEPWRHYPVGQYVRWSVKAEAEDASAAVVAAVIRFADQIGLTPAGLKENGWQIAPIEVAEPAAAPDPGPKAPERRLRAVNGAQ